MKRVIFILAIMAVALANKAFAQDNAKKDYVFQESKSTTPQYPGGEAAMQQFIDDSLQYPQSAIDNNVSGRVVLRFYVDAEGDIKGITVQQGIDAECNEAAIACVKKMPKWEPAQLNGRNTTSAVTVPVVFKTKQVVYEYEQTTEEADYEIYQLFDKKWVLVEIEGKEMPAKTPHTPYFYFTFDKKNKKKKIVEGNLSCASFVGKYSWNQKNWKLRFSAIEPEKAKCKIGKKDKETKIIDGDLLTVFKNCMEYRIENGQLVLGKIANDRFKPLAKFEWEKPVEKKNKK